MLNLTITMHPWKLSLMMLFWFWLAIYARQNTEPGGLLVTSPKPGEALQGIVTITGTTALPGFTSAEVSFAYSHDKPEVWFLIQESQQAVTDGTIATWDTTTITDGVYDLRLVVNQADGNQPQVQVAGVRVRNYTLIETNTPAVTATVNATQSPLSTTLTRLPEVTVTAFKQTLTPLPTNPAQVMGGDILGSLVKGGLAAAGLFLLGGLYLGLKYLARR
jgi:hypothetical protein